jgi:hypothetical protein
MIISATSGKKDFAPCPEFSGRAVCVDVTPLREYETEYGVGEVELARDENGDLRCPRCNGRLLA